MKIDITKLSEGELLALNRQIVERLRLLQQVRTHERMLEFRVGDRVSFEPEGRGVLFGVLLRYNKKTVTVLTESGEQWKVSPGLLRRIVDVEPSVGESANVISLQKK
jgi:hypothetical protein